MHRSKLQIFNICCNFRKCSWIFWKIKFSVDRDLRPPRPNQLVSFTATLRHAVNRVKLNFPSSSAQHPDAGEDSSFVCQLSPGYHLRSEIRDPGRCGSPVQLASQTNGSEGGRLLILIVSQFFLSRISTNSGSDRAAYIEFYKVMSLLTGTSALECKCASELGS